jgi:hypothetical protein
MKASYDSRQLQQRQQKRARKPRHTEAFYFRHVRRVDVDLADPRTDAIVKQCVGKIVCPVEDQVGPSLEATIQSFEAGEFSISFCMRCDGMKTRRTCRSAFGVSPHNGRGYCRPRERALSPLSAPQNVQRLRDPLVPSFPRPSSLSRGLALAGVQNYHRLSLTGLATADPANLSFDLDTHVSSFFDHSRRQCRLFSRFAMRCVDHDRIELDVGKAQCVVDIGFARPFHVAAMESVQMLNSSI